MKIALAQIQQPLGDLKANAQEVIALIQKTRKQADLLVFPEASFVSYPPKDLLFNQAFIQAQNREIKRIHKSLSAGQACLLPAFKKKGSDLLNGVFFLEKGKAPKFFAKEFLANSNVFFEARYFTSGKVKDNFFTFKKKRIQLLICEDLWHAPKFISPDFIVSMHASPFTRNKQKEREKKARQMVSKHKCPFLYVNRSGAQDEIIFDGASFVLNKQGRLILQASVFKPDLLIYQLNKTYPLLKNKWPSLRDQQEQALILGLKEFCSQLGFSKVHLGLSGGIDSALVLYLAVQAFGQKKVTAYFLPTRFTQKISYKITQNLCAQLKVKLITQDIDSLYSHLMNHAFFQKKFKNPVSSQNIQSRIRSLFLMAMSGEQNSFLLGTGNKSELATGYSTLYGDLSGGLHPLGDLWKTEVCSLAQHIHKKTQVFSPELLNRAPSAELTWNQKDEQDLMPYKKLDIILEKLVQNQPPQTAEEKRVALLFKNSEFKRKQAPPLLKMTDWALGEDRQMPLAHKFF